MICQLPIWQNQATTSRAAEGERAAEAAVIILARNKLPETRNEPWRSDRRSAISLFLRALEGQVFTGVCSVLMDFIQAPNVVETASQAWTGR